MPQFGYGEKPLGLERLRIATFNPISGVIGTSIPLPESVKFACKPKSNSDTLKAQFMVTSVAAWTESYEFELEWNGLPFDAMVIMLGGAFAANPSSNSTPNRVRKAVMKGRKLYPYFAIGGYSIAEGDGGMVQGFYKCMLTEAEAGVAEDGKFFLSKSKGMCVAHEVTSEEYAFGVYKLFETGITFDDTAFQALFA